MFGYSPICLGVYLYPDLDFDLTDPRAVPSREEEDEAGCYRAAVAAAAEAMLGLGAVQRLMAGKRYRAMMVPASYTRIT